MKHPLKWQREKGLLAEALALDPEESRRIEEKIEAAIAYKKSLRQIFEEVGEMDISDELWANFLYTFGWWDGRRRP